MYKMDEISSYHHETKWVNVMIHITFIAVLYVCVWCLCYVILYIWNVFGATYEIVMLISLKLDSYLFPSFYYVFIVTREMHLLRYFYLVNIKEIVIISYSSVNSIPIKCNDRVAYQPEA